MGMAREGANTRFTNRRGYAAIVLGCSAAVRGVLGCSIAVLREGMTYMHTHTHTSLCAFARCTVPSIRPLIAPAVPPQVVYSISPITDRVRAYYGLVSLLAP